MLTRSVSVVNVILVLLLALLIILAPVHVLAGISPTFAAGTAAVSSSKLNSSSTGGANSFSNNGSSSSSSSSSSSASSLLFSSSSAASSDKLETRYRERTAGAYDTKDTVVMGPIDGLVIGASESHVQGKRSQARTGVEAVHSRAAIARPLASHSNSHLIRERRSSDTGDPSGSSPDSKSAKSNTINSKNDNNTTNIRSSSNKKHHESDKSPKEDRGRTPFWSEEIQLGCHELRARRYISDGFCTSAKPIREVVCTGACLPIKDLDWYAEFVKTMTRNRAREWQCVEDYVKKKRVRLLCRNGESRFYWIRVVKSCKCEKTSNSNSTYSRRRNRRKKKRKRKGRNNRTGRGS